MQIIENPCVVPTYDTHALSPRVTPVDATIREATAEERLVLGGFVWRVRRKRIWSMWSSYFMPSAAGERLLPEVRTHLETLIERNGDTDMTVEVIEGVLKQEVSVAKPPTIKVCRWIFPSGRLHWVKTTDLKDELVFWPNDPIATAGEEYLTN